MHPMKYGSLSLSLVALLTVAADAAAVASAELYQNQAYTYGRFEARVRFAAGDGVVSSFFLWKPGSEVQGTYWNELDFEKLGADCRLQTNPLYGLPVVDHGEIAAIDADLCSEYHTYTFEWTPTYIAYRVDGVEVRRDGEDVASAFAQNAASGMQIHFNIWPGDASFGGNFDPAILPVQQYVSWVQYSSFSDGSFPLEWREEFDGPTLPSGWAVGNWPSPKNLSNHQPANLVLGAGVAVLALTADGATGFDGLPPPDVASGDAGTGTGTGAGDPVTGGSSGADGMGGSGSAGAPGNPGGAGGSPAVSDNGAAGASGAARRDDGACSYVASTALRSSGAVWLTLGAAALAARRRRAFIKTGG